MGIQSTYSRVHLFPLDSRLCWKKFAVFVISNFILVNLCRCIAVLLLVAFQSGKELVYIAACCCIKSLLEMTFSVALLFDVDEPQLMEGAYVETCSNPT